MRLPDRRRERDDLSRYWAALVGGAPPDEVARLAARLDPTILATIDRVRAVRARPRPDPAFVARLEEDLMAAFAPTATDPVPLRPPPPITTNGHVAPSSPLPRFPTPRARRRGALAPAATALLVLLTAGLAYVALGPGRPDADRPTAVSGAVASPTPAASGVTAEETLAEVAFPAAALPAGDRVGWMLFHASVPAGARGTWPPSGCPCPGFRLDYLLDGSYTARADGPAQVLRAGGAVEEPPAGAAVVLGPGDAMVTRTEAAFAYENRGATPADLVSVVLFDGLSIDFGSPGFVPTGWLPNESDQEFGVSVPAGPVRLRLRRATVDPGAVVPAPPAGALQLGTSIRLPFVGRASDGAIRNIGRKAVTAYVATLEPTGAGTGTPAVTTPAG